MKKDVTTIAGERLVDLEAALDHMEFEEEPCGCISIAGRLPQNLSDYLDRALIVIEAETIAHGHDPCFEPEWNPMRQLIERVGAAEVDPA
ncbi:MAG: hypothetical protein M3094_01255 [Actinomycetia bacterium]|nr:hypothetical protein [Actinomycetes bacterium]